MNAAVLSGVAARRSALYWILAEFFLTCPSQALVERLRENLAGLACDADVNPLAAGLAAVRDALPEHADAAAIDQLAIEYTRLFGGISPSYGLPPPYESVQRETAAPAELAVMVSTCYSDAGFAVIDQAVPPDHLGVELKFMAMLCHTEIQEWQHNNAEKSMQLLGRQRNFLDDHVLKWVPDYLRLVQAQAQHVFFRGVAALVLGAIPADRALLEEMLTELHAALVGHWHAAAR
jgi:TorA maturation chaperone TorD